MSSSNGSDVPPQGPVVDSSDAKPAAAAMVDGEARADALVIKQKATDKDCRDLVESPKTQLLYSYRMPKHNEKLHEASMDIENQNGLEVMRVIMDKADKSLRTPSSFMKLPCPTSAARRMGS